MLKSHKQKMNFYSFNLNKIKGEIMWNTKKMAVLLGGLMLAGAFQTVQAKDWTGEDMTAYAKSQGKPCLWWDRGGYWQGVYLQL